MSRYAVFYERLLVAMLVVFGVVEALEVPVLTDPQPLGSQPGVAHLAYGSSLGLLLRPADGRSQMQIRTCCSARCVDRLPS